MARRSDLFGARVTFETDEGPADLYRLRALQENGVIEIDRLPFAIRVMLEGVLRQADGLKSLRMMFVPWHPGVPVLTDLAAMRDAMTRLGGDPSQINPQCPADMVIDHSV